MIPLIGILLCVYLAFKGVEIFQIALCNKERPKSALVIGVGAVIMSLLIAGYFAMVFLRMGLDASPQIPNR